MKYPHCITHRRFTLPASQFHLIFWEAGSRKESLLPDPLPDNTPTQRMSKVIDSFEDITNSVQDDTRIIEALTEKDIEAATTWDSSIGSTTLLNTFEGLSHSDIVTLTLFEVNVDAEKDPLPNFQQTITEPAESSTAETFEHTEHCQIPFKKGSAEEVSPTPEIILPSVVKAPESIDPLKVCKSPPALLSSNSSASNLSNLFHRHPSHQSTPTRVPLCATHPKVDQRFNGNEALLAKPAELFGGYKTNNSPNPVVSAGPLRHPFVKLPNDPQKPFSCPSGITSVGSVSTMMKSASQTIPNSSPTKMVLSTEALRLKLMKRLKAKKKKLAKLNQLLNTKEGESTPRPDSTDISSPYSVTSSTSTYDSPAFDHFFAEFLSPAMSASSLSPDSTDHLEILTNSQSVGTSKTISQENSTPASKLPVPLLHDPSHTRDSFLDEFMPESKEQQSGLENVELNVLDIFF